MDPVTLQGSLMSSQQVEAPLVDDALDAAWSTSQTHRGGPPLLRLVDCEVIQPFGKRGNRAAGPTMCRGRVEPD